MAEKKYGSPDVDKLKEVMLQTGGPKATGVTVSNWLFDVTELCSNVWSTNGWLLMVMPGVLPTRLPGNLSGGPQKTLIYGLWKLLVCALVQNVSKNTSTLFSFLKQFSGPVATPLLVYGHGHQTITRFFFIFLIFIFSLSAFYV